MRHVHAEQPHFIAAVVADAKADARNRGERSKFHGRADALRQVLRLMLQSDGFLGLCLYRAQARLDVLGMRFASNVLRRIAAVAANVSIGRTVILRPGVILAHGDVVIDGFVEIDTGTFIAPGAAIGLSGPARKGHMRGPTIGKNVWIGTGSKILGPLTIGDGARIGANAVVLDDVPAKATAAGVPATIVRR